MLARSAAASVTSWRGLIVPHRRARPVLLLGAALLVAAGCSPEVSLGYGVEESESGLTLVPDTSSTSAAGTTLGSSTVADTSTSTSTGTTTGGDEGPSTSLDTTASEAETAAPEPLGCFQHPMRSACEMCLRASCCEDYLRCLDDPFCWCITFCLPSPTSEMCEIEYFNGMCDGGPRGAALRECAVSSCSSTCGDP